MAGRKMHNADVSNLVIETASITGTGDALAVLSFALGVEQMEQMWRGFLAVSGWMCAACAVPMASTKATQSTDTNLLHRP
jgi:hypothetical protein